MSGPPALTILLPLEGTPRVWIDSMTDSEERRLWEWIGSRDDLLALVGRALEIAEEAKAA
jgi:hypothetical protein